MKEVSTVIWSFLFLQGVAAYKLVCVYTNWSQYRPDGGKFFPNDIDPSMCTHLIYVYAKLQGNKLVPVEWNDDNTAWQEGMFQRVNAHKQTNQHLKTLLGVGGWMMGSKDFSRMASTRRSRRIFAKSTMSFLRKRKFDGLAIDWQHPTMRGGNSKDRVNFSLLLQEVRRAIEEDSKRSQKHPLLLAVGVSASKYIIDSAYEVMNISKYADLINVFAYDLHGHWDNYTGHPSPLYAREDELGPASEMNIDASMKYWISSGVDRSKLVLGISTYGRTFTLQDPQYNGYMVPTTGPGIAGDFTREPGMIAYYERCSEYFYAPRVWDKKSKVAYWYSGDQWIAGEDVESVKHKVNWVRHNDIAGIMFSSLDMDDFSGLFCTGDYYPLLKTINEQFNSPLQPMDQGFKRTNDIMQDVSLPLEKADYTTITDPVYSDTVSEPLITTTTEINVQTTDKNVSTNFHKEQATTWSKDVSTASSTKIQSQKLTTNTLDSMSTIHSKRNERLINDLLNIFKGNYGLQLDQPMEGLWPQQSERIPSIFGKANVQQYVGLTSPRETTTQSQPFTVHPWNSFRMQHSLPNNKAVENNRKQNGFDSTTI